MRVLMVLLAVATPAAAQLADAPGAAGVDTRPAAEEAVSRTRRTLEAWFAGYEFVPTDDHFARLGVSIEPALVAIAADSDAHPLVRARAVSAMVHARGLATERAMVALLGHPDAPSLLRRKAVLALTERTGTRYLDLVVSAFGSAHGDVPLREACARALRAMGPAADQTRDTLYRATVQPTVKGLLGELKEIGGPR